MVEFRLLGAIDLSLSEADSAKSLLARPKDLALLAYLALASPRGFQRRDVLLALFWPDADEARARGALNQSLYRLRQSLGDGLLLTRGGGEIGLNWAEWWCDAVELRAAAAAGRYEDVVDLYRGELLAGFHVNGSSEFEQWLDSERRAAGQSAITAALQLATDARAGQDLSAVIFWLRKALALQPFDEIVVQRLMESLHEKGESRAALEEYERFVSRLAAEMDVEPAPETTLVAVRIHDVLRDGGDDGSLRRVIRRIAARRAGRRHKTMIGAAASAAVLLVVSGLYVVSAGYLSDEGASRQIVLADFVNRTPDEHLANAVTEALATDLSQSASIHTASPSQVGVVLKRMGRDSVTVLTDELAREVALREGLRAVLRGEVAIVGTGYVITAQLISSDSGHVLLSARETAARAKDVIPAVDRLSERLRKRMGDSLRGTRANRPLEAVTTQSLDALKLYSAAQRVLRYSDLGDGRGGGGLPGRVRPDDRAVALLEEAIALDSTFASAYRSLGVHLFWLGNQRSRVSTLLTRAYQLRGQLTERERLETEGTYYHLVTGETDRAIACFEQMLERDPNDMRAMQQLGLLYFRRQDFTRAIAIFERDWRTRGDPPALLYTSALLGAGRIARADSILQRFASLDSTGGLWQSELIRVRSGLGDMAAVDTLLPRVLAEAARSGPQLRSQALRLAGMMKVWRGEYADGVALLQTAWQTGGANRPLNQNLTLAGFEIAILRDRERALRRLDSALAKIPLDSMQPADRPYHFLAVVFAQAGEIKRANEFLAKAVSFPAPYGRADAAAPAVSNVAALTYAAAGNIDAARRTLAQLEREMGCWYFSHSIHFTRAAVEEQAGTPDSVIAALERGVAVPACGLALSYSDLWGPLNRANAHERLGQLYEARGDTRRAAHNYTKFVQLWPNPDPELRPRWRAAKARLGALSMPNAAGHSKK